MSNHPVDTEGNDGISMMRLFVITVNAIVIAVLGCVTELLSHKHLIYNHLQHNAPILAMADSDAGAENVHLDALTLTLKEALGAASQRDNCNILTEL